MRRSYAGSKFQREPQLPPQPSPLSLALSLSLSLSLSLQYLSQSICSISLSLSVSSLICLLYMLEFVCSWLCLGNYHRYHNDGVVDYDDVVLIAACQHPRRCAPHRWSTQSTPDAALWEASSTRSFRTAVGDTSTKPSNDS